MLYSGLNRFKTQLLAIIPVEDDPLNGAMRILKEKSGGGGFRALLESHGSCASKGDIELA